ncbi:MAG TPA: chemotaxis protein CheW [Bryobacteraceae bacterium]|nr:chemotaxis protein CheW [Bryobacteraceae bacterium]
METNIETMVAAAPTAALKVDRRAGKYLAFQLGNEEFAVQVLRVREIMGIQEITAVPHTPNYVKGVINLRGKVIPVVDLRLKFGLPEIEYTQRTCIIVAQIANRSSKLLIGIIVDCVSEVLTLQAADIEDTPDFGSGVELPYLLGMAKVKAKVKILLDIDMVLTAQEVMSLGPLGA